MNESLRAFNQERDFYAAAVGIPGLRTAQYVIDHMMPGLIAAKLERSLGAVHLQRVKHPNVKRMILKSVAAGRAAPLLTGARFYDVGDGAMAFDVDVKWVSDITADMDVVPAMGLPAEGLGGVPVFRPRREIRRHGARPHGSPVPRRSGVRRHRVILPGSPVHLAGRRGRRRPGGEPRPVAP